MFAINKIKIENIENKIENSLACQEGKLIFKGEPLRKVIEEMSRYSNIDIELEGQGLKKQ